MQQIATRLASKYHLAKRFARRIAALNDSRLSVLSGGLVLTPSLTKVQSIFQMAEAYGLYRDGDNSPAHSVRPGAQSVVSMPDDGQLAGSDEDCIGPERCTQPAGPVSSARLSA